MVFAQDYGSKIIPFQAEIKELNVNRHYFLIQQITIIGFLKRRKK